jgi:hypothetical protein
MAVLTIVALVDLFGSFARRSGSNLVACYPAYRPRPDRYHIRPR